MHELLLYGQVPAARHEQVLKILAGVAAMQPRHTLQRCILYRPTRAPDEPGANLRRGGSQAVGVKQAKQTAAPALYYTRLVQRLSPDDLGAQPGPPHRRDTRLAADIALGEEPRWAAVWDDVPDTGDRGVSMRSTTSTDLLSGDPHAYMVASGPNQFVTEYYIEGDSYVHGNVIVSLHRVLHEPGVRNVQDAPKVTLPSYTALDLLDPSGAYILEAKVRVHEFNNGTVLEGGVNELKKFQAQIKGCVDLFLPDRLTLDTRVKYKAPHAATAPARNR